MALVDANKTYRNQAPNANSWSEAHNHPVGADGFLLVAVTMSNTVAHTTATYGGQSMTQLINHAFGGLSQNQAIYGLVNPPTGSNNVITNFSGNQWNPISLTIISFTGSGGFGVFGVNDDASTPHSQSLNISANSMIYATGISVNTQSFGYDIAGSTRTNLFQHSTNRQVEGALSATGLSAGATDVTTKADFGTISNLRVEITEAGGGTPGPNTDGDFFMMF